ncbi:MAG: hypothetical protein PHY15_07700 [Eubacteriales bacterium]|nr:hypothetical protein [Eubacteriales bacterium]MDD4475796.1 hypothetical protein [Eubacteriales bacterium]
MLKITPVFEIDEKERLCSLCEAEAEVEALTYAILSDESEIGVCQFKFTKDGGAILLLRNTKGSDDEDALVIAGRAALDFIERNSGNSAYYHDKMTATVAKKLGFKDGKLDLEGYFGQCCNK